MIDFVNNFQVFLPFKYRKKKFQKKRNVLKRIFVLLSFFVCYF